MPAVAGVVCVAVGWTEGPFDVSSEEGNVVSGDGVDSALVASVSNGGGLVSITCAVAAVNAVSGVSTAGI